MPDAEREAVRQHPELGLAGSKFNANYVVRYQRYKRENPKYFNDSEWPVTLANEIEEKLRTSNP